MAFFYVPFSLSMSNRAPKYMSINVIALTKCAADSGRLGQEFGTGIFKHTGPPSGVYQFFRRKIII
jgi:hypothetical protein